VNRLVAFLVLLISVGFTAWASLSMGQDTEEKSNTVLVIGTARITGDNIAKAKRQAINEAMTMGVERYLTERLGSQGMINNFHRIVYEIIPRAGEVVEHFNILAEDRMGGAYKVLIRLKINDKVMEEKLKETGLIIMEGPSIKILFLVSQVQLERDEILYWWSDPQGNPGLAPVELALHRVFQERGFTPINRLLYFPEGDYSDEMKSFELSDEEALQWGRLYSADVVIYGKCDISPGVSVSVDLKALGVKSGLGLAQGSQTVYLEEKVREIEELIGAIERAVDGVATDLVPAMMGEAEAEKPTPRELEVALKGFGSFRQVREVMEFLKRDIKGVESVKQTRIRGNYIILSVQFLGEEDSFLEMVSKNKNLSFDMNVERTVEGPILFSIGK